jgi:hypothetical protein
MPSQNVGYGAFLNTALKIIALPPKVTCTSCANFNIKTGCQLGCTSTCTTANGGTDGKGVPSGKEPQPDNNNLTTTTKMKSRTGAILLFLLIAFGTFGFGGYYVLIYLPEKKKSEVLAARDLKVAREALTATAIVAAAESGAGGAGGEYVTNPMNNA